MKVNSFIFMMSGYICQAHGMENQAIVLRQAIDRNDMQTLQILGHQCAYLNAVDPASGNTALHHAVLSNKAEYVRCLLSLGADRTIINNEGKKAAELANSDIQALFKQQEADEDESEDTKIFGFAFIFLAVMCPAAVIANLLG